MEKTSISRKELMKAAKEGDFSLPMLLKELEDSIPSHEKAEAPAMCHETLDIDEAMEILRQTDSQSPKGFANSEAVDEDYSHFFETEKKSYLISVAETIVDDTAYVGELLATGDEETGRYYVFQQNESFAAHGSGVDLKKVGLVVTEKLLDALRQGYMSLTGYDFVGAYVEGHWLFYRCVSGYPYMTLATFSLINKLFSRNTGLFETEAMLEKYAIIVGAGSVGSLMALELARAGLGKFILIDGDILELHNLCRHQLGLRDLGRYKVSALKDAILNINPQAMVTTYCGYLQDAPLSLFQLDRNGIVIGTADNRNGNAVANDFAVHLAVPFVATGCWSRAAAGEVFYWRPEGDLPSYREAYAGLITEERPSAHHNYFGDEDEEAQLRFEPGTSVDMGFVTNIAIKLSLDLLNLNTSSYSSRVLSHLSNITLVCNTNRPDIGGELVSMFPHPLFISTNIRMKKKKMP